MAQLPHTRRLFLHGPLHGPPLSAALIALSLLAGALGCAGGGGGTGVPELHPWRPPDGRVCGPARDPGSPAALVDTAAVRALVRVLDLPDGGAVLSFRPDTAGVLESVVLTQSTLPDVKGRMLRDSIDALARRHPRGVPAVAPDSGIVQHTGGRLLIRVADGDVTALTAGPSLLCRPVLIDQTGASVALEKVYERLRKTGTAALRWHIDAAGVPTMVEITEGTGDVELDRALLEVGWTLRFRPAIVDQEPRPLWIAFNLTVKERCPSRRDSPAWRSVPRWSSCWDRPYAPSPGGPPG